MLQKGHRENIGLSAFGVFVYFFTFKILYKDGKYLIDFAKMLRQDNQCYSFTIENTVMLCPGHPNWNKSKPGQNIDGLKWDKIRQQEKNEIKLKKSKIWKKSL